MAATYNLSDRLIHLCVLCVRLIKSPGWGVESPGGGVNALGWGLLLLNGWQTKPSQFLHLPLTCHTKWNEYHQVILHLMQGKANSISSRVIPELVTLNSTCTCNCNSKLLILIFSWSVGFSPLVLNNHIHWYTELTKLGNGSITFYFKQPESKYHRDSNLWSRIFIKILYT